MNQQRPTFQLIPPQQLLPTWVPLRSRKVDKKDDKIIVLYVQITRPGIKKEEDHMVEEGYFSSCGYRIKQEDPVFYLLGVGRASHVPDADPYEVVSIITDEVAYRNRVNKSDSLKVRIFRHEYIASEITKDTPLMVEQIYPAMGGAPLEQRLVIVTQGEPAPKPGMLN